MHYKTIKFNIKIPLNIQNVHFFGALCAKSEISRLCDLPRPPTRALYAKLQREKLQFLSLLTTILKALICWKLESFRGLRPLGPRQGLCPYTPSWALRRPLDDPTRMRRARCATRTDFSAHPFFCKSWVRHCTHPPLLVQVACPQRRRSWGGGGGANISFCPPPPPIISSTWNIYNNYVMQE